VIHQLHDSTLSRPRSGSTLSTRSSPSTGSVRGRYLLAKLLERAHEQGVGSARFGHHPVRQHHPARGAARVPGDEQLERRIRRFIRWNAAVMVVKANHRRRASADTSPPSPRPPPSTRSASTTSSRARTLPAAGDAIYIQGHAAPGIYARAFSRGDSKRSHLDNFRFEIGGDGLSSYPHPRLMPDFWEFPTVSMGLGPINSIYHARFNRYLTHRGLDDTSNSRIWCFIGDGEVDEPETLGSISLAAREGLDNLTWVINCNLQRLDGPVRGNGQIITELEAVFRGAGWNVIKVIWGSGWDELSAKDDEGALIEVMNNTVDGEYQRYKAENGAYVREHFFGKDPRTKELVERHERRGDLEPAPGWSRLPQDLRRLQGRHRARQRGRR
jgi:pyruvate dehydrogenase E1 component